MTNLLTGLAALATFALFVGVVWRKVLKDFFAGLSGAIENVNGRPAKIDKAGREVEPAVPSLSVQLADLHSAVSDQTELRREVAAQGEITAQHAKILAEHSQRFADLDRLNKFERITSNVAQGKVIDAIAEANRNRDTIDADSA